MSHQRSLYQVEVREKLDGTIAVYFDQEPVYMGPLEHARQHAAEVFAKRYIDPELRPILEQKRAQARAEMLIDAEGREVEDS